jgi:hypothetical protein
MLAQRLLVDLQLLGDVGLSEAESGRSLDNFVFKRRHGERALFDRNPLSLDRDRGGGARRFRPYDLCPEGISGLLMSP